MKKSTLFRVSLDTRSFDFYSTYAINFCLWTSVIFSVLKLVILMAVFALEKHLIQDSLHPFVHWSKFKWFMIANWARLFFFKPLFNVLSANWSVAFCAINRIFNYIETNEANKLKRQLHVCFSLSCIDCLRRLDSIVRQFFKLLLTRISEDKTN